MPVTTNEVTAVVPTIAFPCSVKGKALTATLTHVEENDHHYIYHVSFSDGYSSQFLCLEDDCAFGSWIDLKGESNRTRTDPCYAKAIADDLNALCGFSLNSEIHLIVLDLPHERNVNAWVLQDGSEPSIYSVYYKNDYRFTLERVGKSWKAYSRRQVNPEKISELLVHFITSQIDARH